MKKTITSLFLGLAAFGASAQIFSEDFNAGIPGTWTLRDLDRRTPASQVAFVNAAWVGRTVDGNGVACSNSWYSPAGRADDWMISPQISIPNSAGNIYLLWKAGGVDQSYPDGYELKVSTTDTAIASFTTNLLTVNREGEVFQSRAILINNYKGQDVYFAWRNNSDDMFLLYVDDVLIREFSGVDMAAGTLDIEPILGNVPHAFRGTLVNRGDMVTSMRLNYSINGGTPVSQNMNMLQVMPTSTYEFAFTSTWTPPSTGVYDIKIWADNINGSGVDTDNSNDTLRATVKVAPQVGRTAFYEMFTSSTCPPCEPGNTNFRNALQGKRDEYVAVKYQVNWPGTGDPYYTLEVGTRRTDYGITGAPTLATNGNGRVSPQVTGQFTGTTHLGFKNRPAFISMDAEYSVSIVEKTVDYCVEVAPTTDIPNARLFIAITEKETVQNKKTNGENVFYDVFKKMIPNAEGAPITLQENRRDTICGSYEFKGNFRLPADAGSPINHATEHSVENFENLEVAAWVQDGKTGVVYNAVRALRLEPASVKAFEEGKNNIRVYPNPTVSVANFEIIAVRGGAAQIRIVNMLGATVVAPTVNALSEGRNVFTLNTSSLSDGIYFIETIIDGEVTTTKLVIKK